MQMAQRAGVDSVAVSYGAQSEAVLREWCPRLVVDDFSELDEWLARCD
jgi:phosphoglycolate phosphatase